MNAPHVDLIAAELALKASQVRAVGTLLEEGATVPFVARYRKEATGSLDEVAVTAIRDRLNLLAELDARRSTILSSLEKNGHLTDTLKEQVMAATALAELEDIYLPFRPKRRTRATIAREKGLEALARMLLAQEGIEPAVAAAEFIDPQKEVADIDEALAGARDIIAEIINEDPRVREQMRQLFLNQGIVTSRVATDMETAGAKFKDYFDWQEPVAKAPSHRILALRRGEREDVLNLSMLPPPEKALALLTALLIHADGDDARQVQIAIEEGYPRLLARAMETELRLTTKQRADAEAIRVFAENLRQLLLAAPLGARRVLAADPGFRTGCKLVCLDRQGKLLAHDTIHPHGSARQAAVAADKVGRLIAGHRIEAVAVGNGTAGRETETFIRDLLTDETIPVVMVNESGASIYSASEIAREEFPDLDLTIRGAVSIGRRLMDPLAELVKIDPKSIGVGQYQHDVDQTALRQSLDDVVASCVNAVGVDVNRASAQLLTYVSGLGPRLAKNIVAHRDEHGAFSSRAELRKVPRLGPKAFEQAAGFLRIRGAQHPLDGSAVHPESYHLVDAMAADLGCSLEDLLTAADLRRKIDLNRYVSDSFGIPTLTDILAELAKPGRDPRQKFEAFSFASGIESMEDLRAGMRLPGIVTNITGFGAFVDIGVHQDGLVHISQMADRFVRNPAEVVKVHQKVRVTVMGIDLDRRRIALSMKSSTEKAASKPKADKGQRRSAKPKAPSAPRAKRPFNNPFDKLRQ